MANVILFHSVLGLRDVERRISDHLRAASHTVALPDLYEGDTTNDRVEGFEIKERVGWNVICERARRALAPLPETTVLAGVSMGAGVVAEVWPYQPLTSGILLLHGLASMPSNMKPRLPIQLHVSDNDPFFPERDVDSWQSTAGRLAANVEVFRYANAGHYFLDPVLPDYSEKASTEVWEHIVKFLDKIDNQI
jgi:dienelactone hydrolase